MILRPVPAATETAASCLATGVFAMGDARFYARHRFPVEIARGLLGAMAPTRIQDIEAYFAAIATVTESHLKAITLSIYYDNDGSLIPPSDTDFEYKALMLINSTVNPTTGDPDAFQIELPNLPKNWNGSDWFDDNKDVIFHPSTGLKAETFIINNMKPDRKARG